MTDLHFLINYKSNNLIYLIITYLIYTIIIYIINKALKNFINKKHSVYFRKINYNPSSYGNMSVINN